MKKLFKVSLLTIMFLGLYLSAHAIYGDYWCSAINGGTTGAMDAINGNKLNDGDSCTVKTSTAAYFYHLNATSGAAESAPNIISPDSNPGTKRWLLLYIRARDPATDDDVGDRGYNDLRYAGIDVHKYNTIWVPAGAMIATTTNGAASGTEEYATNDIMFDYLAFDGATEEFAAVNIVMPEAWDRGTIKVKFYWAPGDSAASAADTVEWEIAGGALSNDDAIDAALGTGQVISDVVLAGVEGDMHISGATPAITVGGTPALEDLVHFKISRNVSGTDDMTEDAWLFGAWIQYVKDNDVTAW